MTTQSIITLAFCHFCTAEKLADRQRQGWYRPQTYTQPVCTAHHVSIGWVVVLDCGKASQAIFVHVHPQGVTRGHQHVDTQIKLEPVQNKCLETGLDADTIRVGIHAVGDEWGSERRCVGGGPGTKANWGYSGWSYL